MKALLKHYRQSPRKVRLVADLIRGMDVEHARTVLNFSDKKSAPALKKLLESALANAKENDKHKNTNELIVKDIRVDKGIAFRRFRPRAFGRAAPFRRQTSRVSLTLASKTND